MSFKRRVLLLLSAYDPQTHEAAVEMATKYDWHLDANLLTPLRMMNHWQGDGILCSLTDDDSRIEFIKNAAVPAVDLSTWRTDISLPRISTDNKRLGQVAAEHFLYYSHYNFSWYSSSITPFGETRFEGYQRTLIEHGYSAIRIDAKGRQNHAIVLDRLRKLPRPCAILCMNDADAGWLASLCLEHDFHVPMDFAILGIDNNPLICDVHSVPLSSIDKNAKRITTRAADLLQLLMDGKTASDEIQYIPPVGLVTRASSDAFVHGDDLIRNALQYLKENLSEGIGTPEVATHLGVSRSTLNKRFQDVMNISLRQTLVKMRLKEAAYLLSKTKWTLDMIAESTGFTHASHLSNSFKKHFNESPNEYRTKALS